MPKPAARYERKYKLEGISLAQAEAWVRRHPAFFSMQYPQRQVNNIYFDDPQFSCFQANVHGLALRSKYRVRWYGDFKGKIRNPYWEVKSKEGQLGFKESHSIEGLDDVESLVKWSQQSPFQLPFEASDKQYLPLHATLANHYQRKYFLSRDHNFRLTLDWDLNYIGMANQPDTFSAPIRDKKSLILELKYAAELDGVADKIGGFFPFRVNKSSKYVEGIAHHYG